MSSRAFYRGEDWASLHRAALGSRRSVGELQWSGSAGVRAGEGSSQPAEEVA